MTDEQETSCHAIIHTAAVAAGGVASGLAQLPGTDNALIVPIQLTMIISLGAVFGKTIEESVAKSILATQIASLGGRAISQFLIGWIPIIGNVLNSVTAAGITETIGWAVTNDFSG